MVIRIPAGPVSGALALPLDNADRPRRELASPVLKPGEDPGAPPTLEELFEAEGL